MDYSSMSMETVRWVFWIGCFGGVAIVGGMLFLARVYWLGHTAGITGKAAQHFFSFKWSAPAVALALFLCLWMAVSALRYRAHLSNLTDVAAKVHWAFTEHLVVEKGKRFVYDDPQVVMEQVYQIDIEPLISALVQRGYLEHAEPVDSDQLVKAAFAFGKDVTGT